VKNVLKYPIYRPYFTGNEKKYVQECFDDGWISSIGKYVEKFESSFSKYLGVKYSVSSTSGTSSLHLALLALEIKKGDEVLLPSLTFVATANVIAYCGATPVFVDSCTDTFLLDTEDLKKKITKKTKAVIAANLYGNSCNLKEIQNICKENGIYLIEDNAESLGTTFENKLLGNFGDISCFSFYGNKTITTGEGGMVCTNNFEIAEKIKLFKEQGFVKNAKEYYTHSVIGYNYRMTNVAAAIGFAQLESINEIIDKKRIIAKNYIDQLSSIHELTFQHVTPNVKSSYWLFNIVCRSNVERDSLAQSLIEKSIDSRPLFLPLNELNIFKNQKGKTPNSKKISQVGLSLPSYPDLNEQDIKNISSEIKRFYQFQK
jgi:perosamine synthetase